MTDRDDLQRADQRGDDTDEPWPGDDPWRATATRPAGTAPGRGMSGPVGRLVTRYRTARLSTRVTVDITAAAAVMAVAAGAATMLPDEPSPAIVSTRSTTVVTVSTTGPPAGTTPTTARRTPEPARPATRPPRRADATPQSTPSGQRGARGPDDPSGARTRPARPAYPDCLPAWLDGAAPLRPGDPGYSADLEDDDGDGIVCERGRSADWGGRN